MLTGLPKHAGSVVRQRGSSPKLQVLNTALMTAQSGLSLREARADSTYWGRLTESAVGAHLANAASSGECELHYWREKNCEVDFIVTIGRRVIAIEVKSGRRRESLAGMSALADLHRSARTLLVGGDGIAIEDFLTRPVRDWATA
jgi:hypothetical protein